MHQSDLEGDMQSALFLMQWSLHLFRRSWDFKKKNVYVNGHTSIYAYVYVYVYAYVYVHVHVYSV